MSLFIIPSNGNGSASWKQRTQLDGSDYVLAFQWLQRGGHFLLHLYDSNESPIVLGIKPVASWDLLGTVTDTRRPPGALVLFDKQYSGADPSFTNLGTQFELRYLDTDELATLTAQFGSLEKALAWMTLATTIDPASSGQSLPQATIYVASTGSFPPKNGKFWVRTHSGVQGLQATPSGGVVDVPRGRA